MSQYTMPSSSRLAITILAFTKCLNFYLQIEIPYCGLPILVPFSNMKNDPTGAFFCVRKVRLANRRSS